MRRPEVSGMHSRKVHGSPNSENWNRAHPVTLKICCGAGCSGFVARERLERARSTDAAVRKRKTYAPTGGSANVSKRKTYVPLQRFPTQQRCKNSVVLFKNNVTLLQQR